jgi:hypothetical protein
MGIIGFLDFVDHLSTDLQYVKLDNVQKLSNSTTVVLNEVLLFTMFFSSLLSL